MAIALDTHILRPLLAGTVGVAEQLATVLDQNNQTDGCMICAAVYAELLASPQATIAALNSFLDGTGILVAVALSREIWQDADLAFRAYADRRVAAAVPWPRRILADFLIGAHALRRSSALMTLNDSDFGRIFPSLPLIVPWLSVISPPQV